MEPDNIIQSSSRCATESIPPPDETRPCCPKCDRPRTDPAHILGADLSPRQLQVVGLVAQAKTSKEIAHHLHIAEGTIKEYLFTVFRKVGVKNRVELALWYHRQTK